MTTNLADLGMDSLMGAEIKQMLERNYDLVLGVQEIRNLTFSKLHELSKFKSNIVIGLLWESYILLFGLKVDDSVYCWLEFDLTYVSI